MSHNGCFRKWLMRCPIDTASALTCTVDSGSFGKGTSGAISLTSAATDDRSPTSMLGSTAETAGSSAKYDLYVTRINSSRNSKDRSKFVFEERNMLGNYWRIELLRFITCNVTLGRIPDKVWKWVRHPSKTRSTFSTSSPIERTDGQDSRRKWFASLRKQEVSLSPIVWEDHFSPLPVENLKFSLESFAKLDTASYWKPWPLKAS